MAPFKVMLSLLCLAASAVADIPTYCVPPDKGDDANLYTYADMSSLCATTGDCTNACVMLVTDGDNCGRFTSDSYSDLNSALAQQVTKDGTFETTTVGDWIVSFDILYTSAISNQNVLDEWSLGLSELYANAEDETIGDVWATMVEKFPGSVTEDRVIL
ncbi:hypothetical protein BX600DRAFT_517929 [Xylariales sp. PMI_506]|nr:hypothetical protein BX600DRAFT_517929 [Xylariales sp. PMI_506]